MAAPSPLAGLLDRTGGVFSLAWQLARAFTDEYDRQRSCGPQFADRDQLDGDR